MPQPGTLALSLATAAALSGAAAASSFAPSDQTVTVFAATSLTNVFEAISALHEETHGQALRLSFAPSSTLARQIEAGLTVESSSEGTTLALTLLRRFA